MKKYLRITTSLAVLLMLSTFTQAQWVWNRSGAAVFSPASPTNLTFVSNPSLSNNPADDSSGVVRFTYSANDAEGFRHTAINSISPDGYLEKDAERAFVPNSQNTSFYQIVSDRQGGYYGILKIDIPSTSQQVYCLQHYDEQLSATWSGDGILIMPLQARMSLRVAACKDGSAVMMVMEGYYGPDTYKEYTRGFIQVYDSEGNRIGSGFHNGTQFSSRLSQAALFPAEDEGVWLVFRDWIAPNHYYRFNKIYSDGTFLSEADTSLRLTFAPSAFTSATCISTPDGGLITLSGAKVQYYSPEGQPRWSQEECTIEGLPSTLVGNSINSALDSSLYLLIRNPRGDQTHNDLFYCAKVSIITTPMVQWTTRLSRHGLAPEWGYSEGEQFHRSALIGTDYYYCFADTVWKLNADGNYVWGEDGKHIEIGDIGNSYESQLFRIRDSNLLMRAWVEDRAVLIKLNSDGETVWNPVSKPIFPDRFGWYCGTAQLKNGSLRSLRGDNIGASIFDFSPDGWQLEPVLGRRVLTYEPYPFWRSPSLGMLASGGNMLLWWGFSSGWELDMGRGQYLTESEVLFPDEPMASDTSRYYPSGDIFSDDAGGFYTYFADWNNFTGVCFDHIYPDGSTEWEVPKVIFPNGTAQQIHYNHHFYQADPDGGFWFVSPYDSSYSGVMPAYIQKLKTDGSLQFSENPTIPFELLPYDADLEVSSGGFLYFSHESVGLSATEVNRDYFLTDEDLVPLWDRPLTLFTQPATGSASENYDAGLGSRTAARSDGAICVLATIYNYFSSSVRYYGELRLQIIHPDGTREVGEQGFIIGKSRYQGNCSLIIDIRDGIWVIWDDFEDGCARAMYYLEDGTPNPGWDQAGIPVVDRPGFQYAGWTKLQDDNSIIVRVENDDGVVLMQRLTSDPRQENRPAVFRIAQAYPNPFNDQCRILYEISKLSDVKLTIYDLAGREVAVAFTPHQATGAHSIMISSVNWSAGLYFAMLRAGDYTTVIKMVLVK